MGFDIVFGAYEAWYIDFQMNERVYSHCLGSIIQEMIVEPCRDMFPGMKA